MNKLLLTAAIASLAIGTAMTANAEEHGNKGNKMFEKVDTNNDGVVTRDEHNAHSAKKFDEMDASKDGKVTKDEAKKHHDAKRAKWNEMKAAHDAKKAQ